MNPLRGSARWLFESGRPRTMALFRICLGLSVLFGRLLMGPDVELFYSDDGLLTNRQLAQSQGERSPYAWSLLHFIGDPTAVRLFFGGVLLVALTLTLGLFTRISSVLLFLGLVSLRWRNPLVVNSADQLLAILSFWLMFADAGRRWSLDAWWRARRGQPRRPWNGTWVLRTLQLQMCWLYLGSALYKLQDPDWVSGETMFFVSGLVFDWVVPGTWMMDHPAVYKAVTWGALSFELSFPLLVWNRLTRGWMVALGVLFHTGIAVCFGLYFFSAATIALLSTFVPLGEPDDRSPLP